MKATITAPGKLQLPALSRFLNRLRSTKAIATAGIAAYLAILADAEPLAAAIAITIAIINDR